MLPGKEGQLDVKRSPMEQIGLNGRRSLFFFPLRHQRKKGHGKVISEVTLGQARFQVSTPSKFCFVFEIHYLAAADDVV